MTTMTRYTFLIFTLLTATVAMAQPTQPVSAAFALPDDLRALIQQASGYYPALKQQQEQIKASDLQVDIAQTALKPNVTGNATYQYLTPVSKATLPVNGQPTEVQFQPNHNLNAYVGASQTIYDWNRTKTTIERANASTQLLKRSLELTQHNLGYQVAAAYYGVGFVRKAISVQDSVIKTATANVKVLAGRLQNGDALEFDVISQQVRVKAAINSKIELQNQLERQLAVLTFLTGNPNPEVGPGALMVGSSVSLYDLTSLSGDSPATTATNKDVLLAQDRVRQAQTEVKINELVAKPSLSLNGTAGFRNGYLPNINNPRFNIAAGVSFSVPIYQGHRGALQIQAAKINEAASQYGVTQANAQLRQSLALLNADIRSNQTRLANLDAQVLQSRKALQIAIARLKSGVITNVELESAEVGVEQVELGRLNFQYQLTLNYLEMKRLLGEPLN
jgi:outer membrane protein